MHSNQFRRDAMTDIAARTVPRETFSEKDSQYMRQTWSQRTGREICRIYNQEGSLPWDPSY